MKVFIESVSPISIQEPLCEKWFSAPIIPSQSYNLSTEPDYKEFVSPIEARRMGKLLKRAVATALHSLKNASKAEPDAIIIGTGLGCVEHTEKFLNAVQIRLAASQLVRSGKSKCTQIIISTMQSLLRIILRNFICHPVHTAEKSV